MPASSSQQAVGQTEVSPGAYLQHCREAAGLGVRQAAATLAALPWAIRAPTPADVTRLCLRLNAAEDDTQPLGEAQAELVAAVFPFDAGLYVRLQGLTAVAVVIPVLA